MYSLLVPRIRFFVLISQIKAKTRLDLYGMRYSGQESVVSTLSSFLKRIVVARIYCQQCGVPLPRRANQCIQCETIVEQNLNCSQKESKGFVEWLAIGCVSR